MFVDRAALHALPAPGGVRPVGEPARDRQGPERRLSRGVGAEFLEHREPGPGASDKPDAVAVGDELRRTLRLPVRLGRRRGDEQPRGQDPHVLDQQIGQLGAAVEIAVGQDQHERVAFADVRGLVALGQALEQVEEGERGRPVDLPVGRRSRLCHSRIFLRTREGSDRMSSGCQFQIRLMYWRTVSGLKSFALPRRTRCRPYAVYIAVMHGWATRGGSCQVHHSWKARMVESRLIRVFSARPGVSSSPLSSPETRKSASVHGGRTSARGGISPGPSIVSPA
ncbi:hypothetical protein ABZ918_31975 [Streptomyces viridosporus]|uniref:hypothetical protein n=1 Tax=Streptomyces viridosporus TaxID=67581 RepID=UPI00341F6525